jgi:uncharacterized membrane protein HdeD (DUF308 family)
MRTIAYTGFGIGVLGAAVDFGSAYSYWATPMSSTGSGLMISAWSTSLGFAVVLVILGVIVLFAGVLTLLPSMAKRMRPVGLLMEVLGVVMALTSYLVPGMGVWLSYAMLFAGAVMILNGALMQRRMPAMEHE